MSEEKGFEQKEIEQISKPPVNILFNPTLIIRKNIWEIDIVSLLEKLLKILEATGSKDLRICGIAALSSAMILKLKVESIFALERIAMQKKPLTDRSILENLNILELPYRYEATYPVSLEDLLKVLESMLEQLAKPKSSSLELEPLESTELDKYLVTFEKLLERYKEDLYERIKIQGILLFNDFVANMSAIDKARYFIALLYLAMQGKVNLEELEDDIRISIQNYASL